MLKLLPFEPGVPIATPGLYAIGEADYHSDLVCSKPSLSSGIARTLLATSPLHAWHNHPRLNLDQEKVEGKTLDFGRAIHAMVLRRGAEIAVIDAKDFRTKAAQEERDAAYDAGMTPILSKDFRQAENLVRAARDQATAFVELPGILGPETIYEHAAVWREGDAWCRAMMDMVRVYPGFVAIVDFKSTDRNASVATIGRQVFSMGYDVQLAFYRRGLMRVLGPKSPPVRCFLMTQERETGAMSVVELDRDVLTLADKKVATAIGLWEACQSRDEWPGYPPFIGTVTLPPWAESAWLEREIADDALASAGYRFALPIADAESPHGLDVLRAG